MEVKTFYEQLYGQKKYDAQEHIEINHSPSVICRDDQNQWNKQLYLNLKSCGPRGSECSHETSTKKN